MLIAPLLGRIHFNQSCQSKDVQFSSWNFHVAPNGLNSTNSVVHL